MSRYHLLGIASISALTILAASAGCGFGRPSQQQQQQPGVPEVDVSRPVEEEVTDYDDFTGRTEADFANWLYTIAVNQANAYIRKSSRRKKLLAKAADSLAASREGGDGSSQLDWPRLYAAVLELKPQHQTIITLRFFENMRFEEIAQILDITESTARVTLHRILSKLRKHLQNSFEEER